MRYGDHWAIGFTHVEEVIDELHLICHGKRAFREVAQEPVDPNLESVISIRKEARSYERRYFATGSALFIFIWSKNFWKSNGGGSFSLLLARVVGVLLLLSPSPGVVGTVRECCCDANEDNVAGEGTAVAVSRD